MEKRYFRHALQAQQLPPNDHNDHDTRTAYDVCLWLQAMNSWGVFANDLQQSCNTSILDDMPPDVAGRVLGYGIRLAPSDSGRNVIVRDILACQMDRQLLASLAYLYVYGLCRVFYNPKGPTPDATPVMTPRLALEAATQDQLLLLESGSDPERLRKETLLRDNCRCVFTNLYDATQAELQFVETRTMPASIPRATNVAHIISQSLTTNIAAPSDAAREKFEWARTAGAMLEQFGGFDAQEVLGDRMLHNPKNAFTASLDPLQMYGELAIWLTPVKDAHTEGVVTDTYHLNHYLDPGFLRGLQPVVTFRNHHVGNVVIPAPDPRLLALHAACAQIAHRSGAAEYLEAFYKDTQAFPVMTAPGAADELGRALKILQMVRASA